MSFRKPCVSCVSKTSVAPCSSEIIEAEPLQVRHLHELRVMRLAAVVLATLLIVPSAGTLSAQKKGQVRVNPDAATMADFLKRVNEYVAVHKKLEDTLPKLPKYADPKQLD